MELDLSPERFGSKAPEKGPDQTMDEILAEADRLAQVRKDAKIIAQEVVKELNKQEATKKKEVPETVPETIPVETVTVVEVPEPGSVDYTLPIVSAACGFLIGALLTSLCFIIKLIQIRRESERW